LTESLVLSSSIGFRIVFLQSSLTLTSLPLLDEPTEGIQPSIIIEIEEAITRIKEERGVSVMLVEQYFEFAQSLADYFYLLENGSLIMEGFTSQMDEEKVRSHLSV
jgi:urea transport system ATP-binding protein